jgi:dihydrolipoamide dehydrogenase
MSSLQRIAVIGGGPGGYTAAIRAAQRGASVVLFEREDVGGVCLNRGCIPSKALIESARLHAAAAEAARFGVRAGPVSVDWKAAQARKSAVVERLRKGVEFLLKKNKVVLKKGVARLEKPGKVVLEGPAGGEAFDADGVILATGSRAAVIPGLEPDGARVLDSDGILALDRVPASLAVVGGGAIGIEWACLFSALGARVEVVEILGQLVPGSDPEAAAELARGLKKRKVGIHVSTKVEGLEKKPDGVAVRLSGGKALSVECVLVSVGRRPWTGDALGSACGVAVDRGRVPVDAATRTNVPGVFAIGDLTGEIMLAHYASHQGTVAAENLTGGSREVDRKAVPKCIFSDPEVAWVGYTPAEAEAAGVAVLAGSFPFRALGRAHAAEELGGFVKVLAEKESGRIVGFHVVGPRATELVAEGTLAVKYGLTARQLEETIHAHPTFAEAAAEAAGDVLGIAVNK